jgi:hypothetical protein
MFNSKGCKSLLCCDVAAALAPARAASASVLAAAAALLPRVALTLVCDTPHGTMTPRDEVLGSDDLLLAIFKALPMQER